MSYPLSHFKQYLAHKRYEKKWRRGKHDQRHYCAHFIEEEVKTQHVGIEENLALTHGGPKPKYRCKERDYLKVEEEEEWEETGKEEMHQLEG